MLAPDNRTLLLDVLRPPAGQTLDRAIGTTFTLDLSTALIVPLAFAGFQLDEQPDPIEVMESLRRMSGRIDVFCQAGVIGATRWPSDLLALLEGVIHEVRRPRPGHVFHPKVWVLRFLDQLQEPSYRLIVLSRNLTADRSWDTILSLDGRPEGRPIGKNEPLAQFVAALSKLTVTQLSPERLDALVELAEELRFVNWDLPKGVREAHFHPIGLPGSGPFPVEEHFRGYRKLVVSPFVRDGAVRRIMRPRKGEKAVLVSRGEELSALQPDILSRLEVYELDPTAALTLDEIEGDSRSFFLTNLHAKIYVVERARRAHLFVGSSNATDSGLRANIEFLCELTGPVSILGVDALVGGDAPFRAMLTSYVASDATSDTDEVGSAGRALDGLLIDIAGGVPFRTTVANHNDGWVPHIGTETEMPSFPEGTQVTIAAYNRPDDSFLLHSHTRADLKLSPRALADVTPFLLLTARRRFEEEVLERSTVVCSLLEGAPDDRFQEILARQIDTPEKFLRFLSLLIGFASGYIGDNITAGAGAASWGVGPGQGVLELLARAISERPESIDHLASVVEYIRRGPNAEAILPPAWDGVWLPVLEARRAMVEEEL